MKLAILFLAMVVPSAGLRAAWTPADEVKEARLSRQMEELKERREDAKAIKAGEELMAHSLKRGVGHVNFLRVLEAVADLYEAGQRHEQARELYLKHLEKYRKEVSPEDVNVARFILHLAAIEFHIGELSMAESYVKRGLDVAQRTLDPSDPTLATFQIEVAELYQERKEEEKAEALLNEALKVSRTEAVLKRFPLAPVKPLLALGGMRESRRRHEEAEDLYGEAIAWVERVRGPKHPDTEMVLRPLADLYEVWDPERKAEGVLKRLLAVVGKAAGPDDMKAAYYQSRLARFYVRSARLAEAETAVSEAIRIADKNRHPVVNALLFERAQILRKLGRDTEAERDEKRLKNGAPRVEGLLQNR